MTDNQKINLFCVLEDIQEQLLIELHPHLRHGMKHWAKDTMEKSRMFIKSIDKTITDTDGFGTAADLLRDKIEEFVKGEPCTK